MMNSKMMILLVALSGLFFLSCTTAPVQSTESEMTYNYAKLKLMDLDEMTDLLQNRVNRYKRTGNEELMTEALQICLSRPDEDGMVDKLIEIVRFNLDSDEQWAEVVDNVTDKSIAQLKNETTPVPDQVTYLILLENLVAQFQPEFIKQYQGPLFETEIIEKIAQADIQVSDAARAERQLNLMTAQRSPSEIAQALVRTRDRVLSR